MTHVFIEYGSFNPDVISSDTIEFVDNKFDIITRIPEHEEAYYSLGTIDNIINAVNSLERMGRTDLRITFFSDDEPYVNKVYERGTITRPLPITKTRDFVMRRRRVVLKTTDNTTCSSKLLIRT